MEHKNYSIPNITDNSCQLLLNFQEFYSIDLGVTFILYINLNRIYHTKHT